MAGMSKIPVKLRAVIYQLSPNQQKVMSGIFHDFSNKTRHRFGAWWWIPLVTFGPWIGEYMYAENYKEKEKMKHRY